MPSNAAGPPPSRSRDRRIRRDFARIRRNREDGRTRTPLPGASIKATLFQAYRRAVEWLADLKAPGNREGYLVTRGQRSAERLSTLGSYSQLDATTENMATHASGFAIAVTSDRPQPDQLVFTAIRSA